MYILKEKFDISRRYLPSLSGIIETGFNNKNNSKHHKFKPNQNDGEFNPAQLLITYRIKTIV